MIDLKPPKGGDKIPQTPTNVFVADRCQLMYQLSFCSIQINLHSTKEVDAISTTITMCRAFGVHLKSNEGKWVNGFKAVRVRHTH